MEPTLPKTSTPTWPAEKTASDPLLMHGLSDRVWTRLPRPKERLCGLSRTHVGELARAKLIRSMLIKHPSARRGIRLIHLPSLNEYLAKLEGKDGHEPCEQLRHGPAKWRYARERAILAQTLRRCKISATLFAQGDAKMRGWHVLVWFLGAIGAMEIRGLSQGLFEAQICHRDEELLFLPLDYRRETRAARRRARAAWLASLGGASASIQTSPKTAGASE